MTRIDAHPRIPIRDLCRAAVPYVSVGVFWCWLHSGWAALLAYHLIALAMCKESPKRLLEGWDRKLAMAMAPCLLAGPTAWLLLPHMTREPLGLWLATFGLSGWKLWLMVPYFGIVHPAIEQLHWAPLRKAGTAGQLFCVAFAGYHLLVLYSLLALPWLIMCFTILCAAAATWDVISRRRGLLLPLLSHSAADLGIVAVAALLFQ